MSRKISIGSKVKYSTAFLRSIACHTGDLPRARGIVSELTTLGASPSSTILARIDWGNPNIPERVNTKNLLTIGHQEAT
jgi:hypothetical protein